MTEQNVQRAVDAARMSLGATVVNVGVKLAAGFATMSVSVLAEAVQSLVDILIALGVIQTIRYASRPADDTHPYGHGKAELLMSMLEMVLILSTSGFILMQAIWRLRTPHPFAEWPGAAAMAFSTVVNWIISGRLDRVCKETQSTALKAEVLHLRSDMLASLGILIALLLVWVTGWHILDPIVAIGFTLVVVITAIRQMLALVHPLMDGALPQEELEQVAKYLEQHPDVLGFHDIRTRMVGPTRHIELHVLLDDRLPFVAAHDLAEQVEEGVREVLGAATVNIHYEPYEAEIRHRQQEHGETFDLQKHEGREN